MSLNQSGAQPKKPLEDGKKAEASSTNRILYGLLAILIIVFIWKFSSEESETMDIPENKISVPHQFLDEETADLHPNIEVEIEEAANPIAEAGNRSPSPATEYYESGATSKKQAGSSYSSTQENVATTTTQVRNSNQQSSYANSLNDLNDNYSYIYTASVQIPAGTYRGLDQDGFARTDKSAGVDGRLNSEAYAKVDLAPVFENPLGVSRTITYQNTSGIAANLAPSVNQVIQDVTKRATPRKEYPSTGIPYGEDAYPLKDTLPWHPYESLAYMREEKETFVAEKVRAMPTAEDLEPNIHPSTLGDRDTRMGFGVVIRPSK